MIRETTRRRRGVAVIWMLMVLGLLTALIANIARQHFNNRRALQQRQKQLQADWLARAGLELAAARLLANPQGYTGEALTPISGARLQITVAHEPKEPPTFLIACEASYGTDDPWPAVRSLTGRFRRLIADDLVRLERLGP